MISTTRGIALVCVCAAIVACAKRDYATDSAAVADSAAQAAAAGAGATPAPLTDANILALLDEVNMADSANGAVAAAKGTNADVKAFGHDMERDHHMLRQTGQELAKAMSVTPVAPTGDTLPATATTMHDSLTATPKGAAFDKAYIDGEVGLHQFVLSALQSFQVAAQDTALKAAVTRAIPLIQQHLDQAQKIQTTLGSVPADSAREN
jgi:putative membrane protein